MPQRLNALLRTDSVEMEESFVCVMDYCAGDVFEGCYYSSFYLTTGLFFHDFGTAWAVCCVSGFFIELNLLKAFAVVDSVEIDD